MSRQVESDSVLTDASGWSFKRAVNVSVVSATLQRIVRVKRLLLAMRVVSYVWRVLGEVRGGCGGQWWRG